MGEKVLYTILPAIPDDEYELLPKIFWTAVALLKSNLPTDYQCGMEILYCFLYKFDLNSPQLLGYINQLYPTNWKPTFPGISILLLKGLCHDVLAKQARLLMQTIATINYSPLIDIDKNRRIFGVVLCFLPLLISRSSSTEQTETIASLLSAMVSTTNKDPHLASVLSDYHLYQTSSEGVRRFIAEVASRLAKEYFPDYEMFTFTVLIQMLTFGPKPLQKATLQIIAAFVVQVNFKTSTLDSSHISVFAPILPHLDGPQWEIVINLMDTLVSRSSRKETTAITSKDKLKTVVDELNSISTLTIKWGTAPKDGKSECFFALKHLFETQQPKVIIPELHIEDRKQEPSWIPPTRPISPRKFVI